MALLTEPTRNMGLWEGMCCKIYTNVLKLIPATVRVKGAEFESKGRRLVSTGHEFFTENGTGFFQGVL